MNRWDLCKGLGIAISSVIFCSANYAIAQIVPDATLPNNSRVTTQDNMRIIEGGTRVGNNLFHSFEQFSVLAGTTADFNNALDIQNIISRITGKSISNINGTLSAKGSANLFLINPNGIIFGSNASLNIGGSFVASTASTLNFADGTKFTTAAPQTTDLLTVSVPIGLQFGENAAPIYNQSQILSDAANIFSLPIGLNVLPGKTLALVGGDIVQEGGSLTAEKGRIEVGSVASNSLVSLNPTSQGWTLGYEGVENFQKIQLIKRTDNGSNIFSLINVSSTDGSGDIQLRGRSVELIGDRVLVISQTSGVENGGDITITTQQLIVRDGAQVSTSSRGQGTGGSLIVNASETVDLIGSFRRPRNTVFSALFSSAFVAGTAGNITINTKRLRIQDGARVSVSASGVRQSQLIPGVGQGGNLTINATESIELIGTTATGSPSGLFAQTQSFGNAGKMTIATAQLIIRNGATINVSSEVSDEVSNDAIFQGYRRNLGEAGELNVTARSILLDNQGTLTSETETGQGGNITLNVQDLIVLRRNSQISTNAGRAQAIGDGGNIFINTPNGFIVSQFQENSDITANAFTGSGGRVQINATSIFGIEPRNREDLATLLGTNDPTALDPQRLITSDITAISQTNPTLNGIVNLNVPDVDINRGLINLPEEIFEPKLASSCRAVAGQNEFIITGRGGLPPNPKEILRSEAVQVGWVSLPEQKQDTERRGYTGAVNQEDMRTSRRGGARNRERVSVSSSPIVEAQGWIVDNNGDIILVATVPSAKPHNPWGNSASCNAG